MRAAALLPWDHPSLGPGPLCLPGCGPEGAEGLVRGSETLTQPPESFSLKTLVLSFLCPS